MADLTDEQKAFVVQRLACFEGPSAVAKAVKETFGVEITRSHVFAYNPTKPGYALGGRWRELFDATRKAFLEDVADVGIVHKSVRLRRLDDMCHAALNARNYGLAMQLLEQAAKEVGGAFTNRRELTGRDGASLPAPSPTRVVILPASEMVSAAVADRVSGAPPH